MRDMEGDHGVGAVTMIDGYERCFAGVDADRDVI